MLNGLLGDVCHRHSRELSHVTESVSVGGVLEAKGKGRLSCRHLTNYARLRHGCQDIVLTSTAPQNFFLPGHHRVRTHSLDMQSTTARARAATTGSIRRDRRVPRPDSSENAQPRLTMAIDGRLSVEIGSVECRVWTG